MLLRRHHALRLFASSTAALHFSAIIPADDASRCSASSWSISSDSLRASAAAAAATTSAAASSAAAAASASASSTLAAASAATAVASASTAEALASTAEALASARRASAALCASLLRSAPFAHVPRDVTAGALAAAGFAPPRSRELCWSRPDAVAITVRLPRLHQDGFTADAENGDEFVVEVAILDEQMAAAAAESSCGGSGGSGERASGAKRVELALNVFRPDSTFSWRARMPASFSAAVPGLGIDVGGVLSAGLLMGGDIAMRQPLADGGYLVTLELALGLSVAGLSLGEYSRLAIGKITVPVNAPSPAVKAAAVAAAALPC